LKLDSRFCLSTVFVLSTKDYRNRRIGYSYFVENLYSVLVAAGAVGEAGRPPPLRRFRFFHSPLSVRCTHKFCRRATKGLDSVFPGSTYEITPAGRLELLECTYEDRSDPNAPGFQRLAGMLTPVFTGQRRDIGLHGWLRFPGLGQAKFTDGTMVAFEPESEQNNIAIRQEGTGTPSAWSLNLEAPIYMQGEALGTFRVCGQTAEAVCLACRYSITDDQGSRNVLERFWMHQVFEHDVPLDVIGVEGLEQISTAGIHLAVQVVVRPQS